MAPWISILLLIPHVVSSSNLPRVVRRVGVVPLVQVGPYQGAVEEGEEVVDVYEPDARVEDDDGQRRGEEGDDRERDRNEGQ